MNVPPLIRCMAITFTAIAGVELLGAEEPAPETAGLQTAAAEFVSAYNRQDAAALAGLFTENGELADRMGVSSSPGTGKSRPVMRRSLRASVSTSPSRLAW